MLLPLPLAAQRHCSVGLSLLLRVNGYMLELLEHEKLAVENEEQVNEAAVWLRDEIKLDAARLLLLGSLSGGQEPSPSSARRPRPVLRRLRTRLFL